MFAINHAATALVLKRRFRKVPLGWLLVSVQLVEALWVLLGAAALASPPVRQWLEHMPLAYVPYVYSLALSAAAALVCWVVLARLLRRYALGAALALGVASHVALDLFLQAEHALAPFVETALFGPALLDFPWQGLAVQAAYGAVCWWLFRGTKLLLAAILALNLAGPFLPPHLGGSQGLLADPSGWLVAGAAADLVLAIALVWRLSRARAAELEGWLAR